MIEFEDSEYPESKTHRFKDLVIKIEDFPCRVIDEDMFESESLGEEFNKMFYSDGFSHDYPTVACHRFEKDELGWYQMVWLKL